MADRNSLKQKILGVWGLICAKLDALRSDLTELRGETQATITARGVLKGDGNGNVSAAVSGTDYLPPSHNTASDAHEALFAARPTMADLNAKQNTISDLSAIRSGAAAGATAVQPSALTAYRTAEAQDVIDQAQDTEIAKKYTKPASGIPVADMTSAVQTSLQKADDALSRDEAERGFTEWSLEDGATPSGLQLSAQPHIVIVDGEPCWRVPLVGLSDIDIVGTPADANATSLSWHGQREGLEISFTATRTRLPTMADLTAYRTAEAQDAIDRGQNNQIVALNTSVRNAIAIAGSRLAISDAKAGFTSWECSEPSGCTIADVAYSGGTLSFTLIDSESEVHECSFANVAEDATTVTGVPTGDFSGTVTLTRTRLRPTAAQEEEWTHKVWEYAASSAFPATGVENRVYVDKSTNLTYRWDATSNSYVQIGGSSIDVDAAISTESANPVQNSAIATALSGKANSAALAAPFDSTTAYPANSYVTHDGLMYKCASSVAAGAWDASSWTQVDLMAPDATFDVLADGRLRISNSSGTELWSQGYALASPSDLPTTTLSCDKVNYYAFATTEYTAFSDSTTYAKDVIVVYNGKVYKCETAVEEPGAWTGSTNWTEFLVSATFTLPKAGSGKVGDFILDVSNANNYEVHVSPAGTLGTDYDAIVPRGESLAAILTVPAGGLAEFYFTTTAFGTAAKPAWKVVRQLVERETIQP